MPVFGVKARAAPGAVRQTAATVKQVRVRMCRLSQSTARQDRALTPDSHDASFLTHARPVKSGERGVWVQDICLR